MSRIPSAGVYAIENTINGRVYVGSSAVVDQRLAKHSAEIASGYHTSSRLRNDIERDGPQAFRLVVLQRVHDLTELEYLEHVWMRRLGGMSARGYNANPARRVETPKPEEHDLQGFEVTFERLTTGMSDAEAANILNVEQVVTPHGGRIWNGKAVKQARSFIAARQRRRNAETEFRSSGEEARLVAKVSELRSQAVAWPDVLKRIEAEGFRVPGSNKMWTRHLLTPLLTERA